MVFKKRLLDLIRAGKKAAFNNEEARRIINESGFYDTVNMCGATLLHYSAEYGNQTITKYLLDGGSEVNAQDWRGWTPLMKALTGKHVRVATILLKAGADVFILNKDGQSSLHILLQEFKRESPILKYVLGQFEKQFPSSEQAARKLIDAGFQLDQALLLKDARIVEYMLERGYSVRHVQNFGQRQTLLHLAVALNDPRSVKLLVERGADVNASNASGVTPAHYLYSDEETRDDPSQLEILRVLLGAGLAPMTLSKAEDRFQISCTLVCAPREAIRLLLDSGLDVTAEDGANRYTVLHYLAGNSKPGIAEELKLHAAQFDVNAVNAQGRTPLFVAATKCNVEMLEFLLERGAETNFAHLVDDCPPLCLAYINTGPPNLRDRCVDILLQHNADPQFVVLQKTRQLTIFNVKAEGDRVQRLKPVVAQLALLAKLGTPITESTSSAIDSELPLKKYFKQCLRILGGKIDGAVALFELLAADERKMAKHLKREKLAAALERKTGYKKKLKPLYLFYLDTLEKRVSKGVLYESQRKKAAKVIAQLLEYRFDETNVVIEKIISYLNIQDLQQLYQM